MWWNGQALQEKAKVGRHWMGRDLELPAKVGKSRMLARGLVPPARIMALGLETLAKRGKERVEHQGQERKAWKEQGLAPEAKCWTV